MCVHDTAKRHYFPFQHLDNDHIFLKESKTEFSTVNIAKYGVATQGSTAWGGVASRAIDGNTNGAWRG